MTPPKPKPPRHRPQRPDEPDNQYEALCQAMEMQYIKALDEWEDRYEDKPIRFHVILAGAFAGLAISLLGGFGTFMLGRLSNWW